MNNLKSSIILVAAGRGARLGHPKLSLKLAGKSLLEWNLDLLERLPFEREVIIVVQKGDIVQINNSLERSGRKKYKLIPGA